MANHLSQTQCLTQAATLTPLTTFGQPLAGTYHQSLQSPTAAAACYYGSSQSLMPTQTAHMNYPSLNNTSPSTDSLFSVSTSLNSLPSECPPRRSDLDLKMETPDGDEMDDFFDLEKHQKARSASFGGSTPYSTQLAIARHGLFAPSLDTIGSVASGYVYDFFLSAAIGKISRHPNDLFAVQSAERPLEAKFAKLSFKIEVIIITGLPM